MTGQHNRKAWPWVLGVAALAVSLVAANRYLHSAETPHSSPQLSPHVIKTAPLNVGVTVKGVVDTPDGIARVDAPAVAAALTVKAVLIKEGATVKVDDPLIQFDDLPFREKVEQAKAALKEAAFLEVKATAQMNDHPKKVEQQELALKDAEAQVKNSTDLYKRGRSIFEDALALEKRVEGGEARPLTEAEKDKRRSQNLELVKAEHDIERLVEVVNKEKLQLLRLKAMPAEAELGQAQAHIDLCKARLKEAEDARDACLVTAKVAGVVEQVSANAGMTFGPSTRTPALLIVPSGRRVVRAEVEAEFAFKIADQVGKSVIIYDDHNFAITYEGTVTRISPAFLAKRGSNEGFSVGPTHKVLECLIEVKDPSPAGKPPLLPGLPVRVGFSK